MQFKWLNKKEENKNLIVFFNGWGMNETPVEHLKNGSFDILMIYDYRAFEMDFSQFNFEKYERKYLICWSMGVYASNLFKDEFQNFDKKIAINGTSKVIDNDFGIPVKIYKVTAKFLNEDSCDKFIKNMFDNGKINPNITITKSIEELREELNEIQKLELEDKIKGELEFDKAIISSNDRIIPTKNQINFWQNKAEYKIIDSTHCPFEMYNCWQDLIC